MKDKKKPAAARKEKREGKSYVYIYTDPKTEETLYVGKGTGKRALTHMKDASGDLGAKIKALRSKGLKPRIEVLCGKMTQSDALAAEAAVIEFVGKDKLGNAVSGHTHGYGRMTFDEYLAVTKNKAIEVTQKALLLNVNQKFNPNMVREDGTTTKALRDITCAEWSMGKDAEKAEYAFAVYHGIVREVYQIQKWEPPRIVNKKERRAFTGKVAPENIRKRYVREFVGTGKKGAQNPVRYSWKIPKKNARKARRG